MTYVDDQGQSMVADGSAILLPDGSGYMTNQYNGFSGNQRYETYIVRFALGSSVENTTNSAFVVYPNPTTGVLNFANVLQNVEIFDMLGRKVYAASVAERSIELTDLASGTYILRANQGATRVNVRFILK